MPKIRKIMHREAMCFGAFVAYIILPYHCRFIGNDLPHIHKVSYTKFSPGFHTLATARTTLLWNCLEGSDHEITLGHFGRFCASLVGSRSGNRPLNRSLTTVDESEFMYSRTMKLRCSAKNYGIT